MTETVARPPFTRQAGSSARRPAPAGAAPGRAATLATTRAMTFAAVRAVTFGTTRAATLAATLASVVLFAPVTAAPAGAQQAVELEALLAASFPSDLTAAPTGGAVAWVENDRGVRNIWMAAPGSWEPRKLTAYTEDDGQELGSLTWSPDASTLVYVRGGSPNRQGEIPNPTSHPDGAERVIWQVRTGGTRETEGPERVASGSAPTFAPDGSGLAFMQQGNVMFTTLGEEAEPRLLLRARGSVGSLRWSPDGSRLAFVSNRGTHAFVGVLDLDGREVQWMDPSVDRDLSPVWAPDGSRLAFIRIPASSDLTLFKPVREAHPWTIRTADPGTGASEEIWRAEPGVGSAFFGVSALDQLVWGSGDHIVFPWERTGWLLLHSVPASGGPAVLLTPGEFEVEHVRPGPSGRTIYYSSNQDDIDRRHLWRVAVDGSGSPERLTSGDGIEWAPTPTSGGEALVFKRSDARSPARAVVLDLPGGAASARPADEARPLLSDAVPASFPSERLVVPEAVTVTGTDGKQLPAQLFLPPDLAPGERRPAVAFFHGGSRRQMLLGFHYMSYYHNSYALNQYLASRGFVVLSVNFRSGTGYGMHFREAIDFGAAGGSEVRDVMGAALYLRGRPDVDPDRVGLWGGSYGGYLTAHGLAQASDLYAAGVDVHGVHDWNVGIATFRPDYNPLEDPEATGVAFRSSPMAHLDGWRSPVLVIHGDDDRNVRFLESVVLVEELRKRDVHVEQLVFPDEVHGFLLHSNWLAAKRATADFLERMLMR